MDKSNAVVGAGTSGPGTALALAKRGNDNVRAFHKGSDIKPKLRGGVNLKAGPPVR